MKNYSCFLAVAICIFAVFTARADTATDILIGKWAPVSPSMAETIIKKDGLDSMNGYMEIIYKSSGKLEMKLVDNGKWHKVEGEYERVGATKKSHDGTVQETEFSQIISKTLGAEKIKDYFTLIVHNNDRNHSKTKLLFTKRCEILLWGASEKCKTPDEKLELDPY